MCVSRCCRPPLPARAKPARFCAFPENARLFCFRRYYRNNTTPGKKNTKNERRSRGVVAAEMVCVKRMPHHTCTAVKKKTIKTETEEDMYRSETIAHELYYGRYDKQAHRHPERKPCRPCLLPRVSPGFLVAGMYVQKRM